MPRRAVVPKEVARVYKFLLYFSLFRHLLIGALV